MDRFRFNESCRINCFIGFYRRAVEGGIAFRENAKGFNRRVLIEYHNAKLMFWEKELKRIIRRNNKE